MNKPLRIATPVVLFLGIFGLGQMVLFPVQAEAQAETCSTLDPDGLDCPVLERNYSCSMNGFACCWTKEVKYDCPSPTGIQYRYWRFKKVNYMCDPFNAEVGCPYPILEP